MSRSAAMRIMRPSGPCCSMLAALIFAAGSLPAVAADGAMAHSASPAVAKPLDSVQFTPDDDVKCLADALESGDPAKGASTILLKAQPGCLAPWHYHSALERVTVIRGTLDMQMKGHAPSRLGAGGFAEMPGKMAHQFACRAKSECLLMVTFDGIYDIVWGKGN